MAYLTKAQILAADSTKFADVEVPEWGGTVRIRTITGTERDLFDEHRDKIWKDGEQRLGTRAFLCAMAICDESGKRLFAPTEVQTLGEKSATALDRVFDAVWRLNGLGRDGVENAAKNSTGGQSEDFGSSSPAQ